MHRAFRALCLLCLGGAAVPLAADNALSLVVTTGPEALVSASHSIDFPAGRGTDPLTAGNGVSLSLSETLTPLSLEIGAEAVVTPIAFMQLRAGASAATGWSLGDRRGLALVRRLGEGSVISSDLSFAAAVLSVRGGAVLRVELPVGSGGNRLQAASANDILYRSLPGADEGDYWVYQSDGGGNRDGWRYAGSHAIQYRMGVAGRGLELLGLAFEAGVGLDRSPGGEAWGEDLWTMALGAFGEYRLSARTSLVAFARIASELAYAKGGDEPYYGDRLVDRRLPYRPGAAKAGLVLRVSLDPASPSEEGTL
ncbi:MAG: hypothetical protein KKA67_02155 [Spirochaetes bacterium]|nr:hypothetical protein [Spirochaetota bacterium]MBU1079262.1 hypothetical protein [Spirochaetota bacterium]